VESTADSEIEQVAFWPSAGGIATAASLSNGTHRKALRGEYLEWSSRLIPKSRITLSKLEEELWAVAEEPAALGRHADSRRWQARRSLCKRWIHASRVPRVLHRQNRHYPEKAAEHFDLRLSDLVSKTKSLAIKSLNSGICRRQWGQH
jgi:hypothetical protein